MYGATADDWVALKSLNMSHRSSGGLMNRKSVSMQMTASSPSSIPGRKSRCVAQVLHKSRIRRRSFGQLSAKYWMVIFFWYSNGHSRGIDTIVSNVSCVSVITMNLPKTVKAQQKKKVPLPILRNLNQQFLTSIYNSQTYLSGTVVSATADLNMTPI